MKKVIGWLAVVILLAIVGGGIWFTFFQEFSPDGVTEENLVVLAEQMLDQKDEVKKETYMVSDGGNQAYMVSTVGKTVMLDKLVSAENIVGNYKIVSDKRIKFLAEALKQGYVKEEDLKVYVVNTDTTKIFETWSCSDGSKILFLISSKEEEIKVSELGDDYDHVVFFSHLKGKE